MQASTHQRQDFYIARLSMGSTELMFPQVDVVSIESVFDLVKRESSSFVIGVFELNGDVVPVYALTDQLELLYEAPEKRYHCAILRHQSGVFGLLCDDVKHLELHDIEFQSIPQCMRHETMPLTHLFSYASAAGEPKTGFVTNSDWIFHYLQQSITGGEQCLQ